MRRLLVYITAAVVGGVALAFSVSPGQRGADATGCPWNDPCRFWWPNQNLSMDHWENWAYRGILFDWYLQSGGGTSGNTWVIYTQSLVDMYSASDEYDSYSLGFAGVSGTGMGSFPGENPWSATSANTPQWVEFDGEDEWFAFDGDLNIAVPMCDNGYCGAWGTGEIYGSFVQALIPDDGSAAVKDNCKLPYYGNPAYC